MNSVFKITISLSMILFLSGCDSFSKLTRIFPDDYNTQSQINRAVLELSEVEHNFGKQSIGSVNNHVIIVTNTGRSPASQVNFENFNAPFAYKGNNFPGIGGNCSNVIQPNASCTIVVSYLPTALVSSSQKITINYSDAFGSYAINLTLKGEGNFIANLRFSLNNIDPDSQFDFGTLAQGNTLQKTIYVLYSGNVPATSVAFSGLSSPFSILSSTCGTSISANCQLQVLFNASSAGNFQKDLKVTYANGAYDDETKVAFSGNVASNPTPGKLTYNVGSAYSFGKVLVGSTLDAIITVTYSGTLPATQVTPSWNNGSVTFKGGNYPGIGGNCGSTINTNCTLVLSYTPSGVVNNTNRLTLSYNDGTAGQNAGLDIYAYGRSVALLSLSASTNPLDFGLVPLNKQVSKTITIANASGRLNATNFTFSGLSAPFSIGSNNCGSAIGEGSSCTVNILYKPTAAVASSGTFQLNYFNGTTYQIVTYDVMGSGTNTPVLEYCGGSYNFNSILINTTKTNTVTYCYYGGHPITNFSINLVTAPFSIGAGTTCTGNISSQCVVQYVFAPTTANTFNNPANITFTNSLGQPGLISFTLQGSGTNPPTPAANVIVSGMNFGNSPVPGSGITRSISVTNQGSVNATNVIVNSFTQNSAFSVINHNCANTLAAGSNCTVNVLFNPTTPGNKSDNLTVDYFNGVSNKTASGVMTGAGTVTPQVAANGDHSCAITNIAEVKCWGHNNYGQLGLGDTTDRYQPAQTVSLGQNRYATQLALGYWHSCAILNDGAVKCWGWNLNGQLGAGNSATVIGDSPNEMGDNLVSVNLGGLKAISISAGYAHTCAVLENNQAKCWGANDRGQLGIGDQVDRGLSASEMNNLPFIAVGGSVKQIVADTSHTCALLQSGVVKCWGDNTFGQLGLGDSLLRVSPGATPINLGSASGIVKNIAAGGAYNCAILQNNSVKCWGRNDAVGNLGKLWCQNIDGFSGLCSTAYPLNLIGYGTKPQEMGDHLTPVDLGSSLATPISLQAGTTHMCILLNDGSTKCWGSNTYGELGLGDKNPRGASSSSMGNNLLKLNFGTGRSVQSINVGSAHGCVVLDNQKIKCWGDNRFGSLGLNDYGINKCRGDDPNEMGDNLPNLGL